MIIYLVSKKNNMKLWVVITTFNKVEESYIQMEIIRNLRTSFFDSIYIIHVYNWEWTIDKYLADELIQIPSGISPHTWAADLIDTWAAAILAHDIDYIYFGSSDTWRTQPKVVSNILSDLKKSGKPYAGCTRWRPEQTNRRICWLSTDTFFMDANRARRNKMFPLNYQEFKDKWLEVLTYIWHSNILVEALFAARYVQARWRETYDWHTRIKANNGILEIKQRLPAMFSWSERHWNTPEIWLYCDHDLAVKKEMLKTKKLFLWPYSKKRCMKT